MPNTSASEEADQCASVMRSNRPERLSREEVGLVHHDHRTAARGGLLRAKPNALPEAGERGLGAVGGHVDRALPETIGELEEQRGLADLTRPRKQLDPRRRGLRQARGEKLPAFAVAEAERFGRHTLIIIRL